MTERILSELEEQVVTEERRLLNELRVLLVEFDVTQEDQKILGQSLHQLDDLFLLVVVGEFNSGKSAFINALLGQRLLKEGVTPTTANIQILRSDHSNGVQPDNPHIQTLALPAEFLSQVSIVDTPGTNAVIREHEALTAEFVPRSDMVLFITSADRPFTESERIFLEQIRDWGKKVVVVINKIDIFEDPAELEQVIQFTADNAQRLLGVRPEIFPVSARQALRAKQGEPALWESSRFAPLEKYIFEVLDEKGRLRLKLLNPLGVGMRLAEKHLEVISSRLDLLKSDFQMLTDVDQQLALYREDMARDFSFRMADIENILFEMEQRGDEFFENTFRLPRIFDLLSKDRIQQEFEHQVVGDVSTRIERKINELIDWLVDADLRQWQAVTDHLAERRREHQDRIVGDAGGGSFHYDRERVMESVGREARRVVETYDKKQEAEEIALNAQTAVAASLAVEVGAVGLGTLVTILATTAAADVTGILFASLVAALGLFIIPARRRSAKAEMHKKVTELRENLSSALKAHFQREIDRSMEHIQEAIAPYTRFVRAEQNKLTTTRDRLSEMQNGMEVLRQRIETVTT